MPIVCLPTNANTLVILYEHCSIKQNSLVNTNEAMILKGNSNHTLSAVPRLVSP